jgi:tetratricopeptide (TPR) repeat protein
LSIAYIKIGHIQPSVVILEEAVKKSNEWILDQGAVYYYTAAMKSLERADLAETVWEKAVATDKKSVGHQEKLFSACIRTGNSIKQIASAMELWKLTNDDKYLMWSIVARAQPELQPDVPRAASIAAACPLPNASSSSSSSQTTTLVEPNKILQLSYMMFNTKFIQTGKVTKHLDLDFMLRVLIQQGQCEQALELLRSDLAKRLYGISFQRLSEEAAILLRISRLDEARSFYETLLSTHNADEWSWYLGYFDSTFGLQRPISNPDATKVDAARSLIKSLQNKSDEGAKLRGPYLAELELEKLVNFGDSSSILPLLIFFFNTFSSKPSTYRDMLPYLKYLSFKDQMALLEQVKDKVLLDPSSLTSETPLSVFGTITAYKSLVRTFKHTSMTESERETEIAHLWAIYNAARKCDHPRESTERFCADDLLCLISHYHCDAFLSALSTTKSEISAYRVHNFESNISVPSSPLRHLVYAAIALEHGVTHSKWNWQFKMLLNEVYIALGSIRSCIDQFDGVDMKHIQLDSVGFMFVDPLVRYASINDLNKVVKRSTIFYDESRKSTADCSFEAFQKGSYHKVKEVLNFAERINNSAHRHALRLEHLFISLAEASSIPVALSLITSFDPLNKLPSTLEQVQKFHKNHDGEVLDWWAMESPIFKHIEIPAGNIRSTCYPDTKQDHRILINSIFVQILALLAQYQPPVAQGDKNSNNHPSHHVPSTPLPTRLAPLAKQLEDALVESFTTEAYHESLVWSFVTQTLKMLLAMFALSPQLTTDKPDAANVNAFKDAVSAISNGYEQLNTLLAAANGGKIVSSTNVPLLTSFIVRSLVALPLCLPLLPKLLPGKPKPKTPEEVKAQTSILKASLREIADSTRKQLSHLEHLLQSEAQQSGNFEIDADSAALTQIPEVINQKIVSKILVGLSFSRRDTYQTLLTLIQNKIRDFKTL